MKMLGAMALCWVITATPAAAVDYRYELRANRQVNETAQMALGCFVGGAAGAAVGGLPVVTGWGTMVTPYTVQQAMYLGCLTGIAVGAVGAKVYNYLVLKF